MATPTRTDYSPDRVAISLGPVLVDGYADGEFISVEIPDLFTKTVGTDGKVVRNRSLDRSATITFSLLQTSASNDALSVLYQLDLNAPNGAGVVPLTIRDLNGRTLLTAAEAWIAKAPDVMYDREATSREWTIHCADLLVFVGGN